MSEWKLKVQAGIKIMQAAYPVAQEIAEALADDGRIDADEQLLAGMKLVNSLSLLENGKPAIFSPDKILEMAKKAEILRG